MKELDVCPHCGSSLNIYNAKHAFDGRGVLVRCANCNFNSCIYASDEELYNVWCREEMPTNHLQEISKILNVELGEQFVIYNRSTRMRVVLSEYGLNVLDSSAQVWTYRRGEYERYEIARVSARLLGRIIVGDFKIKKMSKEKQPSLDGITLEKRTDFRRR